MSDPQRASRGEIRRWKAALRDERDSASLYLTLSALEKDPDIAEVYRRLAAAEQAHEAIWLRRLLDAGAAAPPDRRSFRTRALAWLARRLGPEAVLPTLAGLEHGDIRGYAQHADSAEMVPSERSHARLLRRISETTRGGLGGGALAVLEGRHRAAGGNALRAAVLGANDGLLSNFSLVMGVAGAQVSERAVLITGLAGLLAGASSMALGEWISVQSSRELYQTQLETEREEIETVPEEEQEELALIYRARGLGEEQARGLAAQMMATREGAFETLAREELGIDPEKLGGSALEAAAASFLLFAVGAIFPVLPFMLFRGRTAVLGSIVLSVAGLFGIGASITVFTARPVWFSGLRQVLFGLIAAGITYLIGRLIGMGLAG